jgi:hypothetical protein
MVQSGIKVVVLCNGFDHEDPVWGENTRIAKQILKEGGVILRCYEC